MEKAAQILLVDDDDDIRNLLQMVLNDGGYSVTPAGSGEAAIGLIRNHHFDVVVLDLTLPDGNGFRVAEFLQDNKIPGKVIVITGTSRLENAIRGASLGVHDYLTKPFTPNHLLRSIENALSAKFQIQGHRRS
jgi:DNA-binding response OmpR family regulator